MSSGIAGQDGRWVPVGQCSLCSSWEGRAAPTPSPACFISQAESILCPRCELRDFLCGCSGAFLLIQALCLTSVCSWAQVEKLRLLLHLCCFPRWAMWFSAASLLSLHCGHSAMLGAGPWQPEAASVLTVTSGSIIPMAEHASKGQWWDFLCTRKHCAWHDNLRQSVPLIWPFYIYLHWVIVRWAKIKAEVENSFCKRMAWKI